MIIIYQCTVSQLCFKSITLHCPIVVLNIQSITIDIQFEDHDKSRNGLNDLSSGLLVLDIFHADNFTESQVIQGI